MSALSDRLRALLGTASPDPFVACTTAGECLDLAYERAYTEDYAGAIRAAMLGLELAGDDLDTLLSLWGSLASIRHLGGDDDGARRAARARLSLLRAAGWDFQADMEEDLGALLFREASPEELPVLEAALITHETAGAPDHVLADIKLAFAVALHSYGSEGALDALEWCARAYREAGRAESEGGALLYLAHAHAKEGHHELALAAADRLLDLPLNRAMKAAVWMVKATTHAEADHRLEAEGCALRALELYAAAGVRKGAVSAAAGVAQAASEAADHEAAILAWKVAVEQAERGEIDETWAVRLALGHQLLEAGEFALAEDVLAPLAERLGAAGRPTARARTLVSLGHALRHQERLAEALRTWDEAAEVFVAAELNGEAARTLIAAGTLVSREESLAGARPRFERAVELAREAEDDPAALPTALHALGHALCEEHDPDGLGLLDEAISLADAHEAQWHSADFRDTHARGRWSLGDARGAIAEALEAADLFRVVEDPDAAGNAELFAAHVLAESGQWDEAASLYRLIAAEHADSVAHVNAAQNGLGDVLEKQGLYLQAEEARAAARAVVDNALEHAADTVVEAIGDDPDTEAGDAGTHDEDPHGEDPHDEAEDDEDPRDAEDPGGPADGRR
ncbi:hypothetical protein GCM10022377_08120 [Zhihengliuella alba]|uniref:Tetratricopeptide repeat protein n=1 Tax=Zhihengliuella alba TaxID=547018 RepID=A0ABP7CWL2_9MICC